MQNSLVKILSTKKLDKEQLNLFDENFEVNHFDIIETDNLEIDLSTCSRNVIFTSFKGAQIGLSKLGENTVDKQYFCVGSKTESLLNMLGLNVVKTAPYSKDLAKFIIENYKQDAFAYLCNENRLDDLPEILLNANVELKEYKTYCSYIVDLSMLDGNADDVYLWFSPMGVKAMASQVAKGNKWHVAIGATTAAELENENIKSDKILYPTIPSIDGMIELINNHIK